MDLNEDLRRWRVAQQSLAQEAVSAREDDRIFKPSRRVHALVEQSNAIQRGRVPPMEVRSYFAVSEQRPITKTVTPGERPMLPQMSGTSGILDMYNWHSGEGLDQMAKSISIRSGIARKYEQQLSAAPFNEPYYGELIDNTEVPVPIGAAIAGVAPRFGVDAAIRRAVVPPVRALVPAPVPAAANADPNNLQQIAEDARAAGQANAAANILGIDAQQDERRDVAEGLEEARQAEEAERAANAEAAGRSNPPPNNNAGGHLDPDVAINIRNKMIVLENAADVYRLPVEELALRWGWGWPLGGEDVKIVPVPPGSDNIPAGHGGGAAQAAAFAEGDGRVAGTPAPTRSDTGIAGAPSVGFSPSLQIPTLRFDQTQSATRLRIQARNEEAAELNTWLRESNQGTRKPPSFKGSNWNYEEALQILDTLQAENQQDEERIDEAKNELQMQQLFEGDDDTEEATLEQVEKNADDILKDLNKQYPKLWNETTREHAVRVDDLNKQAAAIMRVKQQARMNARAKATAQQREAADTAAYLAEQQGAASTPGSNAAAASASASASSASGTPDVVFRRAGAPPLSGLDAAIASAATPPQPSGPGADDLAAGQQTPPRPSAYLKNITEAALKKQGPENMFRIGVLYNKLHPEQRGGLSGTEFDLDTGLLKPTSAFYKEYMDKYRFKGVVTQDTQDFTKYKNEIDRYYNEHPRRKDPPFVSRMTADAYGGPPGLPKQAYVSAKAAARISAVPDAVPDGEKQGSGKKKRSASRSSSDSEDAPSSKRPRARFAKGSQEAKDEMARIRGLKKKK